MSYSFINIVMQIITFPKLLFFKLQWVDVKFFSWVIFKSSISGITTSFNLTFMSSYSVCDNSFIFPVLLLFPVFVLGGMGGGDIKLYALIGIVFSPETTLLIILKSLIAGLFIGFIKVIVNRSYKERLCYLYRFFKDLVKGILMKDKDVLENSYMESLDREKLKKGCIHFSLPIAIGVVLSIFGG